MIIVMNKRARYLVFAIGILFFGFVGGLLVLRSKAATPATVVEAEFSTLTGNISQPCTDSFETNTRYVVFGSTSCTITSNPQPTSHTFYLSTSGSDAAAGGSTTPWRTFGFAISRLNPGDTLLVRGGTFVEQVKNPTIKAGTTSAPITVKAVTGERPVLQGLLWLKGQNNWTFDGINFTWSATNTASDHMVKMINGDNWRLTNSEIWGAHSYSGLLISGGTNWQVDHNYLHDTYATNSLNQDHLIYISEGLSGGIIERNSFRTSPNGRGIKIGQPDGVGTAPGNIDIRFNTFYDNLGPSNIQVSYGATNVRMTRNIFVKSGAGYANVTAFSLSGTGNIAKDNIGWQSTKVVQSGISGLSDGGGNQMIDPQLANPLMGDFHPQNPAASNYGRYAP